MKGKWSLADVGVTPLGHIPTTPTGGEPTAEPEMCLVTLEKKMGEALVEAYLAAPTLAARVAELEGMLAVAREALEPFADVTTIPAWADQNIDGGSDLECVFPLQVRPSEVRRAAQAIVQLDKEAGGK